MQLGAENRKKVIAAVALIVVAVVLMATRFSGYLGFGSSSAAMPAVATNTTNSAPDRPLRRTDKTDKNTRGKQSTTQSLDPTLRTDLLKISEGTKYEGTGRNIFKVFVEIPHVVRNPVIPPDQAQASEPPQPPPPPPINITFYGFATPQGGAKRIFLAQGEDVFIAREGDIVDRRYKIVRISATAVEILDVLSNNRQSIPLTQG